MSNQKRIQPPAQPRKKDDAAAIETPNYEGKIDRAARAVAAMDRLLAEYDAPPESTGDENAIIGAAQPKPPLRSAFDAEEFVKAFQQEVGE